MARPLLSPHRSSPFAPLLAFFCLLAGMAGCDTEDPAREVVGESIQAHGGEYFQDVEIRFRFRDADFSVVRQNGRFHYERVRQDGSNRIREWMTNEETAREVNGTPVEMTDEEVAQVETGINSVVYFGLLPFHLLDPAVQHADLGRAEIDGAPYRVIEVTFQEDGGGPDWEDRFVYWFHEDDRTLDYLAYRYYRDGGGTRFRKAVNRRVVGGLVIQDYENFTATEEVDDIARYPDLMDRDQLDLVSYVALEEVSVGTPGSAPEEWAWEAAPDQGLQLTLGMDHAAYAPGQDMQILLQMANRLDHSRSLFFATSQRFDLVILDPEGQELQRWSDDQAFLQVLGREELGPGESGPEWEAEMQAPTTPGDYRLRGEVTARGADLSTEIPFQVEGG
jgi:hypothetical protein